MHINDEWEIKDEVSGLKLKVIKGATQDRLHIEHTGKPISMNRDFWFTKDGRFDGTGSSCCEGSE